MAHVRNTQPMSTRLKAISKIVSRESNNCFETILSLEDGYSFTERDQQDARVTYLLNKQIRFG